MTVRAGRVQPVWAGHPWVFQQAIDRIDGAPGPGDAVEVRDPRGNFLGRGFYSPASSIAVRVMTRDPDETLDAGSLIRRVEQAAAWRRRIGLPNDDTTGYRLIHAEGDGLPGLIADVYGDTVVMQLLTVGMRRRRDVLVGAVARVTEARSVLEAPGGAAQRREGIEATAATLRGPTPDLLRFRERGFAFEVGAEDAQKTGFYFDQRANRGRVETLADGAEVLDLYCYLGAFALAAARGGARSVESYDKSAVAVARGAGLVEAHGLADRVALARADVRRLLRSLREEKRAFDVVVLDPPKLAPTVRHLRRARGAYRKLNADALRLVRPGGILASCSCSAALRPDELVRLIALAARDAGREATLFEVGEQGLDHPVPAAFPEGRYLKCAFTRVQ